MARQRRSRTVPAAPAKVWKLIDDPHHMPRWWPGVTRVEGVDDEHFTQVFISKRGRAVRMDFHILGSEPPGTDAAFAGRKLWEQELAGTPFERVLAASVTEIVLEPAAGDATTVTIEQRQKLRGYSRTGGWMVKRAAAAKLDEALEGLERAVSAG
jgi:carbon monoxide dehydrogenase subunit G